MTESYFDSVDERCRSRFEEDWMNDQAGDLQEYLPAKDDPLYQGTLHELVHIDLEFNWKRFARSQDPPRPAAVSDYVSRFPELNRSPVLADLIKAEFELRMQHNDKPDIPEYILHYGRGPDGKLDVAGELEPLARTVPGQRKLRRDVAEGSRLGRYRLVAEHGRGGFSAVWRADDTKMGRRIALKRLGSALARQAETRRRFVSEARVTARLEHPGIVPVYDMSSLEEEHAYYTMKLVRGETLAEKIATTHALPASDSRRSIEEKNLLRSFLDVCHTIDYCHARGVIHRDLKPQNVVVGSFGETIVLDWGLASVSVTESEAVRDQWDDEHILSPEESVETLQGSLAGTPGYMPPEQAGSEFEKVGVHSDIYSLGAMLYHILAGQTAIQAGRPMADVLEDICEGRFPPPRSINSHAPRALEAICLKAMQRRPRHRYESVKQLSSDVERFLADEPVSVHREPVTVRSRRWIRKNRTLSTGLALATLFALIAAVAGWIIHSNAQQRERARVAEIRDAAIRAEASGMLQLGENRWASALEFFEQSRDLVADEPALEEIQRRVQPRAEKLRTIVEAYEYAELAQYYLFDDQISRAAIYAQAAVMKTGILEHDDWWNELAVTGMDVRQVQYLQDEVYRLLGMWASMRLAETVPGSFSFEWLLSLVASPDPDPATEASCRSAMFASSLAQRYRPSSLMRVIEAAANLQLKNKVDWPFPLREAENPSDAGMLGSILDNNISDNSLIMKAIVKDRDPGTVADALLLDALANIPDWYWLTIFVGENLQSEGRYQEAIRTFSHAAGINPEGWMAYARRANAYIRGSIETENALEKEVFRKNALLDIKRAEALAPFEPSFLFDKGTIYQWVDGIEGVCDTYLEFVFNTPFAKDMLSPHRLEVMKGWQFAEMLRNAKIAEDMLAQGDTRYRTHHAPRMGAAAWLWMGDPEKARVKIQEALEYKADDVDSQMLSALIELHIDPQNKVALESLETAIGKGARRWVACQQLGESLEKLNRMDQAREAYQQAVKLAQVAWQRGVTRIALSRCAVLVGDVDDALDQFHRGVAADLAVPIRSLEELLKRHGDERLRLAVREHHALIDPYYDQEKQQAVILRPALKNGDFELELSQGWGETKTESPRIWDKINDFWTNGVRETGTASQGKACFKVSSLRDFVDEDSMSLMKQEFPVTPQQRYRVTVWCRANGSQNRTLGIYSDEQAMQKIVAIPGGTFDWQEFSGEFTSTGTSALLVIACKDRGTVWIDDVTIEAVTE